MNFYPFLKRVFDLLVSFIGLIGSSPLIGLIALLIKLESKGPVFYRGTRVGRFGKPFKVFKFRTMVVNADQIGASSTPDNDPRLTRVGKVLRRFKLDELPQLINILKGEMSFVGPRPQVTWAVELYSEDEKAVLNVMPGIADYAFVMLPNEGEVLRGSTEPDKDYFEKLHPHKIKLTLDYIRNRSFWFDMKIMVDTALLSFLKLPLFFQPMTVKDMVRSNTKVKDGHA